MPKSPRILQACEECRRRKVRCNGSKPRCDICQKNTRPCFWSNRLAPGGYTATPNQDTGGEAVRGTLANRKSLSPLPQAHAAAFELHGDAFDLPPPALLQRLLDIFVRQHQNVELCGCVHMDLLKADISSGRNPFLVYSVLALSALYVSDADASLDPRFKSSRSLSGYYASKTRTASCQSADKPSVVAIQANLCLGVHELVTKATLRAWMYTGLAIRMAQALRMRMEYNRKVPPRQRETRRRTFWACAVLDRLVAYCTFRTQVIEIALVNIHLPCSEVSFAFGQDSPGPLLNDLGSSSGHDRAPNTTDLRVQPYFIKTLLLWGDIASDYVDRGRKNFTIPPTNPASDYWNHELAMDRWRNSLPREMVWSAENVHAHRLLGQEAPFVEMHFLIQQAFFVVHQEYLPHIEEGDSGTGTSHSDRAGVPFTYVDPEVVERCTTGANTVADMVQLLVADAAEPAPAPPSLCIGMAIMIAASVCLWAVHCSEKTVPAGQLPEGIHQARSNFETLVLLLNYWAREWEIAATWVNSLKVLDKFYAVKYRDTSAAPAAVPGLPHHDELVVHRASDADPAGPGLHVGDGLPDTSMIPHGLYYKARLITSLAIEGSEMGEVLLAKVGNAGDTNETCLENSAVPESDLAWLDNLEFGDDFPFWAGYTPLDGNWDIQ